MGTLSYHASYGVFVASILENIDLIMGHHTLCIVPTLTHLPLCKMDTIFADDFSKCIFMNEKICISIRISLKVVPKGKNDTSSTGAVHTSYHTQTWVSLLLLIPNNIIVLGNWQAGGWDCTHVELFQVFEMADDTKVHDKDMSLLKQMLTYQQHGPVALIWEKNLRN